MVVELGVSGVIDSVQVVKHQADRLDFNISCNLWYMNDGTAPVVVSEVIVRSLDGKTVPATKAKVQPLLKAEPDATGGKDKSHHSLILVGVESPRLSALPRDTDGQLNEKSLIKTLHDAGLKLEVPDQPKRKAEVIW